MRYELEIAVRYLRARRKTAFISITTFFTAIGVTIGVAALVIVLAVMNGFEASLRARVLSLTPQIQILSLEGSMSNYATIQAQAIKVPGVTGAAPFIVGQGMLSSGRGVGGVVVRGIDIASLAGTHELQRYLEQGTLASLAQASEPAAAGNPSTPIGALAIGGSLAEKLKVKVGDVVRVVSPILGPGQRGTHRQERKLHGGRDFRFRDGVRRSHRGLHGAEERAAIFRPRGKG